MRGIIVGLGGRAKSWLATCARNEAVELVGFVEPNDAQQQKAVDEQGLDPRLIFTSIGEAASAVGADFVIDVTPPKAHEAVAMAAFEHGLDVLGEKPLSDDFAAAKRIVVAGQQAGRTHMITQNYRFRTTPRNARRYVADQIMGEPGLCTVGFYMPWATRAGTHYVTMPYPLITDMGIHHFDMLRYVLGREPERIFCLTWNQAWGWHAGDASHIFHAEFAGGLRVTHHACGCSVGLKSHWNGDWRIDGGKGSLTWEGDQLFLTRSHPPDQSEREELALTPPAQGEQDAILTEFLAARSEGREPECSSQDNLKSLAMVFAGIKSSQELRWVELAELLD